MATFTFASTYRLLITMIFFTLLLFSTQIAASPLSLSPSNANRNNNANANTVIATVATTTTLPPSSIISIFLPSTPTTPEPGPSPIISIFLSTTPTPTPTTAQPPSSTASPPTSTLQPAPAPAKRAPLPFWIGPPPFPRKTKGGPQPQPQPPAPSPSPHQNPNPAPAPALSSAISVFLPSTPPNAKPAAARRVRMLVERAPRGPDCITSSDELCECCKWKHPAQPAACRKMKCCPCIEHYVDCDPRDLACWDRKAQGPGMAEEQRAKMWEEKEMEGV